MPRPLERAPAADASGRRRRRAVLALALTAAALALVLAPAELSGGAGRSGIAAADLPPMFTATATPVDVLVDGQKVNVNVKANPGFNVYQGFVEECRAGVTYQTSSAIQYNADARPNGPNCPLAPVSSSADAGVADNSMINSSASPEGDTIPIRVGVGDVSWTDNTGSPAASSATRPIRARWSPSSSPAPRTDPPRRCGSPSSSSSPSRTATRWPPAAAPPTAR